jgi:hypothetical protein
LSEPGKAWERETWNPPLRRAELLGMRGLVDEGRERRENDGRDDVERRRSAVEEASDSGRREVEGSLEFLWVGGKRSDWAQSRETKSAHLLGDGEHALDPRAGAELAGVLLYVLKHLADELLVMNRRAPHRSSDLLSETDERQADSATAFYLDHVEGEVSKAAREA